LMIVCLVVITLEDVDTCKVESSIRKSLVVSCRNQSGEDAMPVMTVY
jgi:hypothetical protein